jgi:hypothetical protein
MLPRCRPIAVAIALAVAPSHASRRYAEYLHAVYGGGADRFPSDGAAADELVSAFSWFYWYKFPERVEPAVLDINAESIAGTPWVGGCCREAGACCFPESGLADTGFFVQRYDEHRPKMTRVRSFASDEWVEVMRLAIFHPDELVGAWYFAATGTGIWLNVGATCVIMGVDDLVRFGINETFYDLFPAMPLMMQLKQKGCETVQLPLSSQGIRNKRFELIDLRTPGAIDDNGAFSTRTCASPLYLGGWNHSRPCECRSDLLILNCGESPLVGSARVALRGAEQKTSKSGLFPYLRMLSSRDGWADLWLQFQYGRYGLNT